MKICFAALHKHWGGVANNGGSKTVIKSAEVLRKMGHRVDIAAVNDRHTWVPHPPIIHKIPKDTDVAIANSVSDIGIVLKSKAKRKFWWCRGIEKWQMPKNKIVKKAKKINVIVNASHLLKYAPHGKVCYAGLDLDFWIEGDLRERPIDVIQVGCLYNSQHKTKRWKDFKKLQSTIGDDEHSWVGYGLSKPKDIIWLDHYEKNPSPKNLRKLYQSCHIWYLPSTLEGFCNVGAEAGLCGCLCVYRDIDSGGTKDYCTPETAIPFKSFEESVEIVESFVHENLELTPLPQNDYKKVAKMQKVLREKIGSKEQNMKKFIKLIS